VSYPYYGKVVVITTALLRFESDDSRWEWERSAEETRLKLLQNQGGSGTPPKLVGEFTDVHAVWMDRDVDLVLPDDDD